jgi:protein O-GlcNAc transferase
MNRKQRRAAANQAGTPAPAGPAPAGDAIGRQFALAMQNLQSGRLDLAEAGLRQVIQAAPDHADALNALGFVLHRAGAHQAALAPIQAALAIRPAFADGHATLGSVYQALGRADEAIDSYRRALALEPRYSSVLCNLGNVLQTLGRLDEAVDCYRRALAIMPNDATVQSNLGSALKGLGRLDEAIASFERALALQPGLLQAQGNLANAMMVKGRWDDAVRLYRGLIAVQPGLPGVLSNLGMVLRAQGKMEEAVEVYGRSLALNPDDPAAHSNLGGTLQDLGRLDEARACYERALALKPDFAEVRSNLVYLLNFDRTVDDAALLAAHRAFDRAVIEPLRPRRRPHANMRDPERRLRVGYVSADFFRHPVGYLLHPVLAAHDPDAIEVHCYSGRMVEDDLTEELRRHAKVWRSTIGIDDTTLAEQIRSDGIDLLVDLAGHTAGNRLAMFGHKPAPVQASWIGYFASTGVSTIDYILMDDSSVPADAEPWFTETVVRLPGGRFCYTPPDYAPAVAPPPVLTRDRVSFGSINNLTKVTDEVIALWSAVVRAVPDSRLILKWKSLADEAERRRLTDSFGAHGVEPARLELRPGSPHRESLAQYGDFDIALDPFPFCGGMTSAEALWMGVPIVTLPRRRPVSRQTLAFLTELGLGELAASDEADYVAIAVALARDRDRLATLRAGMRDRMLGTPLCDRARFTRALEAAYRDMWRRWCVDGV